VGIGYDAHQLSADTPLLLGGVRIPHDRGLAGHSDGDTLIHAVIDALLGAAALGDIGQHFPSSDQSLRGISSLILMARTREILAAAGWQPANVDSIIVAEKPKLAPFLPEMRRQMAEALGIELELVSVKATTSDRLGFAGREEGISASAVVTIEPIG
jgi:2-C-methyl-D-erythritol 2,4-cyclodiphosphate synthase